MRDETEGTRRVLSAVINTAQAERKEFEDAYGEVWNTEELRENFSVEGFMAPFVVVVRKSDGVKGTLMFQDRPRFYFNFKEAKDGKVYSRKDSLQQEQNLGVVG